jgi:cell division protein ZipA
VISEFAPSIDELPTVEISMPDVELEDAQPIAVAIETAVDVPMVSPLQDTPVVVSETPIEPEIPVAPEAPVLAVAEVASEPQIRWPPDQQPERVLGLRVVASPDHFFQGREVRLALLANGLRYGPQQIFHRVDEHGNVLASVANLMRPGSLLPESMDGQQFRGLSVFAVLPGCLPDTQLLDGLLKLARNLMTRLGGLLQDEHGRELSAERVTQLRATLLGSDGATV